MKDWNGRTYSFSFEDPNQPIRTWRERRPGHFIFEIESYSKLVNTLKQVNRKSFETPEFEAGKIKWTLSIFPEGNIQRGGQNYISIELKRIGNRVARGRAIDVAMKFFILDQISGQYLVIEDLAERQFDPRGNRWGIARVLEHNNFLLPQNGFIVDDKCTFGAEVYVNDGEPQYSKMSMIRRISTRRFQVPFRPLDRLSEPHDSQPFVTILDGETYRWKLKLYRQGDAEGSGTHFSLYLELIDADKLSNGRNMLVSYRLGIKDKVSGVYSNLNSNLVWYTLTKLSTGFPEFIRNEDFYDTSKGYDRGNSLDVEVFFDSMYALKDADDSADDN